MLIGVRLRFLDLWLSMLLWTTVLFTLTLFFKGSSLLRGGLSDDLWITERKANSYLLLRIYLLFRILILRRFLVIFLRH